MKRREVFVRFGWWLFLSLALTSIHWWILDELGVAWKEIVEKSHFTLFLDMDSGGPGSSAESIYGVSVFTIPLALGLLFLSWSAIGRRLKRLGVTGERKRGVIRQIRFVMAFSFFSAVLIGIVVLLKHGGIPHEIPVDWCFVVGFVVGALYEPLMTLLLMGAKSTEIDAVEMAPPLIAGFGITIGMGSALMVFLGLLVWKVLFWTIWRENN